MRLREAEHQRTAVSVSSILLREPSRSRPWEKGRGGAHTLDSRPLTKALAREHQAFRDQ